jgi:hypothetical protein
MPKRLWTVLLAGTSVAAPLRAKLNGGPGVAFDHRGIVLSPEDLEVESWPDLAREAGLNVIALHPTPGPVLGFIRSDAGQRFLARMAGLGLDVEYELHAMAYLLPRSLFDREPDLFRMSEQGERTPDANLCPSSDEALRIVGERAAELSVRLRPTTHRYFLWADDGGSWCHCLRCAGLRPSDQNVIVTKAILRALRRDDPAATVACLAYHTTLDVPTRVRPDPGVFLEFAPIGRDSSRPITDRECAANRELAARFEQLIAFFGSEGTHVLGYWLDCSRFSRWDRKAGLVKVPYDDAVLRSDLAYYASLSVRSVTTFGVWLNREYFGKCGTPPVREYGAALTETP